MTKRPALILQRDLAPGQIGNICAIRLAEISRTVSETLATTKVRDLNGLNHAAPQFSIVVLKANGSEKLQSAVNAIRATQPDLVVFGFSAVGQGLNNEFAIYREKISSLTTQTSALVGIAVSGEDAADHKGGLT